MPTPWYIFLMLEIASLGEKGVFFFLNHQVIVLSMGENGYRFNVMAFFSHFCLFSLCIPLLTDNAHLHDVNSYLFPDNTQIHGFGLQHASRLHTLILAIFEAILYGYGVGT